MKKILAKVWAFYTEHSSVRHGLVALVAIVIVESAPILTNWATEFFSTATVQTVAVGFVGAAVRWAQLKLETIIHEYADRTPAPEIPKP